MSFHRARLRHSSAHRCAQINIAHHDANIILGVMLNINIYAAVPSTATIEVSQP